MIFIAEVKTHSPFGYRSQKTWEELFDVANRVGDMISIHTDPLWDGSFELLEKARKITNKPILAKGIHGSDDEIARALDCGADFVLVVGRFPKKFQEKCIIEPYTLDELTAVPSNMKALWNSRDLKTGGIKQESYDQAKSCFAGWLCQASNIKSLRDINNKADAILVGTHLEEFSKDWTCRK